MCSSEMRKVYLKLPTHTHLRMTAKYHFIDAWEGEAAYAKVAGSYVWTEHHRAEKADKAETAGKAAAGGDGASAVVREMKEMKGISLCGDDAVAERRFNVPIDVTVPHVGKDVEVIFGSMLDGDACTASWGVDDVEIWLR